MTTQKKETVQAQVERVSEGPARGTTVEQTFGGEIVQHHGEMAMAASAAAAQARVQAAVILALKNPRDEARAKDRILDRCNDPEFAQKAIYKVPRGGQDIEGLSIRFAEEVILAWGNVSIRRQVIHETETERVVNISVMDLQANVTYDTDVTVPKTVERKSNAGRVVLRKRINSSGQMIYIVAATDEEVDVKEAALASKQIRNNGLRLIPSAFKELCFRACRQARLGKMKANPQDAATKMIAAYAEIGVTAAMIADVLGHPASAASPEEMDNLLAVYNGIVERETTWADYVATIKGTDGTPETSAASPPPAGALSDAQFEELVLCCTQNKVPVDDLRVHLGETYNVVSLRKLDAALLPEVMAWVVKQKRK